MNAKLYVPLATLAMACVSSAIAPIGTLYFTKLGSSDLSQTEVGMVTGPSSFGMLFNITMRSTIHPYQSPIAVAGNDIRTYTSYYQGSGQGSAYDLSLNSLNQDYALWPTAPGTILYDGTSDGAFNYTVKTNGTIVRTDRNWQNPVDVNPNGIPGSWMTGITWDPSDDTLWLGDMGGTIYHVTKGGGILSSFQGVSGILGLAMDVDGSLWFNCAATTTPEPLFRFSRSGTALGAVYVPGFDQRAQGIEIQLTTVPEPASMLALAVPLVGLAARRRKQVR